MTLLDHHREQLHASAISDELVSERGYFSARRYAGLEMSTIYWYFVCGLWGFLFPLVYLY